MKNDVSKFASKAHVSFRQHLEWLVFQTTDSIPFIYGVLIQDLILSRLLKLVSVLFFCKKNYNVIEPKTVGQFQNKVDFFENEKFMLASHQTFSKKIKVASVVSRRILPVVGVGGVFYILAEKIEGRRLFNNSQF